MGKSETQRAIASHGDAADGAAAPAFTNTVVRLDVRDEFLQKEITVTHRAVGGIDVERAPAFGRDDEELSYLLLLSKIIEHCPSAAVEQCALVIPEPVQEIKHGIGLNRMFSRACAVTGGKVDAIVNWTFQNAAV